jgi:hypothetical protein
VSEVPDFTHNLRCTQAQAAGRRSRRAPARHGRGAGSPGGCEGGREAACLGSHALDMRPAPRKWVLQKVASEVFGSGRKGVHELKATQPAWDIHGRDLPSGDV